MKVAERVNIIEPIQRQIIRHLLNSECFIARAVKTRWYYHCGMVNDKYIIENREKRMKNVDGVHKAISDNFHNDFIAIIRKLFHVALDSMKDNNIAKWSEEYEITQNHNSWKATPEERDEIKQIKKTVLEQMGLSEEPTGDSKEEYYDNLNEEAHKRHMWDSFYTTIEIQLSNPSAHSNIVLTAVDDRLCINIAIIEEMQRQVEDFCRKHHCFGQLPPSLHDFNLKSLSISAKEYTEQCNKLIDMYIQIDPPKHKA